MGLDSVTFQMNFEGACCTFYSSTVLPLHPISLMELSVCFERFLPSGTPTIKMPDFMLLFNSVF